MGTTVPLQPIAAVEINLGKLFTDEYEFVIPEYQRPYTWGVEHAVQLFVDLQEALKLIQLLGKCGSAGGW